MNRNANGNKPITTNQSDADAGTKLRRAAEKGRLEEVRALLASGAPVMKDAVRINSGRTLEHKKRSFYIAFTYIRLLINRTVCLLCIKLHARDTPE